ncbi:hypothetical protein KIW84_053316 [Lathyrus oleraceus]|uniref:Uncharacterized protein n=1 Tax=Pisum sativum TaxID=3888 RepID=A0A9D4WQ44_PEA|nr:hypothetical protein KIW84_053316 [Pisum sativum]
MRRTRSLSDTCLRGRGDVRRADCRPPDVSSWSCGHGRLDVGLASIGPCRAKGHGPIGEVVPDLFMTDPFFGNVGDGGDRLICAFLVVNVVLHILSRLLSQPSGPPSPPVLLSEPPSSARTPPYLFNLTMSGVTGRLRPRKEDSGSSTDDATIARLPVGDGSVRDGTEHASSSGQVDFSWVADEPLEEESDFCDEAITAHAMVEAINREDPPNWYCCAPKEEDRICHHFPGKQFTMYEFAFREAGMRLPFSSF